MKLKYLFYSTRILWDYHQYFTMKGWLRFKDKILLEKRYNPLILSRYSIELQPKHRYRRSIAKRYLYRLRRGRIDYYTHKYCKPHRVTIIPNITWKWYMSLRREGAK